MTPRDLLSGAQARLAAGGVDDPVGDARRIVEHGLGLERGRLSLHMDDQVSETQTLRIGLDIARRADRVPMSHILGYRDFWGRRFHVSAAVLDPRPETETLVSYALDRPFARVLDLGTGSGCILLTLLAEQSEAVGVGADLSDAALEVARGNAAALGVAAEFVRSDWFEAVEGRFDLIVSNPPYIAEDEMQGLAPELSYEPRMALTPGGDGLAAYRAIAGGARDHLAPGGRLMVEIGWRQGAAVAQIFRAAGLERVEVRHDMDGRDRVVVAENPLFR